MAKVDNKVNKKKSSRSFRGLVTGKSKKDLKKDKKKSKAEETQTTPVMKEPPISPSSVAEVETKAISAKPIDDETVYGAEFDDASKAALTVTSDNTQTKETEADFVPIAIVLLLMDPTTRRFELLQLEFDSTKATVADIIRQIPISATEESLRTQTFDCVCDTSGLEYDHDKPISDYVEGNAVVITVPKTNTKGSEHAAKMAKPILRDPKVEEMLMAAGVSLPDPPIVEEVAITKATSAAPKAPPKKVPSTPTPTPTPTPVPKPRSTETSTSKSRAVTPAAPIPQPTETPKSSNFTMLLIVGAVIAYMARVLVNFQGQITSPLEAGSVLVPGAWRSRCGFVQTNNCKPAYIEMGADGTLQIVENEGVTFSMSGKVCAETEESCVPGAVIEEDGSLKIGGVIAKVDLKSKVPLNPWPFADGIGATKGRKAWF